MNSVYYHAFLGLNKLVKEIKMQCSISNKCTGYFHN